MRYFYSGIQKVIEFLNRNKRGTNVFVFHQVNNDKKQWQDENCCITGDGFAWFVRSLKKSAYEFISLDQIGEPGHEKAVAFTFDDVFEDAYKYAFPILIQNNIPFCVFICENLLGEKGYIANEQLAQLLNEPLCTIGYHTKNHKFMRELQSEQIDFEVDCHDFEKRIQRKIRYFAFPYGSVYACSRKSIVLANRKSYRLAFSTIAAPCTQKWLNRHRGFLPRINVNEQNYTKLMEIS